MLLYNCFRANCGFKGGRRILGLNKKESLPPFNLRRLDRLDEKNLRKKTFNLPDVVEEPLSQEQLNFFYRRRISPETLRRCNIFATRGKEGKGIYLSVLKNQVSEAICFPYYFDGKMVNIKYRASPKAFWQTPAARKVVFGYDDALADLKRQGQMQKAWKSNANTKHFPYQRQLIIVEGEMDKLALNEAGYWNVVSVPDGAPSSIRDGPIYSYRDRKFDYLLACKNLFSWAEEVVLATDMDGPGQALREELARRLGRSRCKLVVFPAQGANIQQINKGALATLKHMQKDLKRATVKKQVDDAYKLMRLFQTMNERFEGGFRKDANDVLVMDGPKVLQECIAAAEDLPISSLDPFRDYTQGLQHIFDNNIRCDLKYSSGWRNLDHFYKVAPGEVTIVTGIPNSGKSEWLDALLLNLAKNYSWNFAIYSLEKKVIDHARHLVEKHIGKPLLENFYVNGHTRMSSRETEEAVNFIDRHFYLIRDGKKLPKIDWVVEKAELALFRYGINGLVIDPYNDVDTGKPTTIYETEYVNRMLFLIKRFAQFNNIHVWFVAHPRILRDYKNQAPTLYDIAGSVNTIDIHRPFRNEANDLAKKLVLIKVGNVRNNIEGQIGQTLLQCNSVNGSYLVPEKFILLKYLKKLGGSM
jgi:twinkle protein